MDYYKCTKWETLNKIDISIDMKGRQKLSGMLEYEERVT